MKSPAEFAQIRTERVKRMLGAKKINSRRSPSRSPWRKRYKSFAQCDQNLSKRSIQLLYNNSKIRSGPAPLHPASKSGSLSKCERQRLRNAPANLESSPTSADYLSDKPLLLQNVPYPYVLAVQRDTTCQVSNDTWSVLCTEESSFKSGIKDQDTIALFWRCNFQVCFSIEIHNSSNPVISAFDTGASPKLVDQLFILPSKRKYIRLAADLCLDSASNHQICLGGNIKLVVHLGDLYLHVLFGVVNNFVVKILLGKSYIDRIITGIFQFERHIVPNPYPPVAILASYLLDKGTNKMVNYNAKSNVEQITDRTRTNRQLVNTSTNVATVRRIAGQRIHCSHQNVCHCSRHSRPHLNITQNGISLTTAGIMEVGPNKLLYD